MSINLIDSSKASPLDLFAARPAVPRSEKPEGDLNNTDSPRGFQDLLRDAKPKPSPSENVQEASRSADSTDQEIDSSRNETKATRDDAAASQDSDGKPSDKQAETKQSDQGEAADGKQEAGDTEADEVEGILSTESVVSETQSAQTLATDLALAQQTQDGKVALDAVGQGKQPQAKAAQQAIAATAQAGQSASLSKAQDVATQSQGVDLQTANQTLQQNVTADTAGGDARSEGQSTSHSQATAQSPATSNAAGQATFNLAGQPVGDGQLPLNQLSLTQRVDGNTAAQVQLTSTPTDSDAVNNARLTRGLANAVQQRGGALTLRLTPAEMGTVRIQMQITGTNISASFHAETASAQTLLTQQLSQLRTSLETQGMNVERLSVQPLAASASSQNASQGNNDSQQQQSQSQQQSGNDGRSRGQYSGDGGRSREQQEGNHEGASDRQAPRGFFDRLSDLSDAAA